MHATYDIEAARAEVFFKISVAADADKPAASNVTAETIGSTAVVFPTELKDAQMQDPHLRASDFQQVNHTQIIAMYGVISMAALLTDNTLFCRPANSQSCSS